MTTLPEETKNEAGKEEPTSVVSEAPAADNNDGLGAEKTVARTGGEKAAEKKETRGTKIAKPIKDLLAAAEEEKASLPAAKTVEELPVGKPGPAMAAAPDQAKLAGAEVPVAMTSASEGGKLPGGRKTTGGASATAVKMGVTGTGATGATMVGLAPTNFPQRQTRVSNNFSQNNRRFSGGRSSGNYRSGNQGSDLNPTAAALAEAKPVRGILDSSKDGHGVLRVNFAEGDNDIYIATALVRRYRLRPGDVIEGMAREPKENEKYWGLLQIQKINDKSVEEYAQQERVKFHNLTPVYPDEQIKLELGTEPLSLRIVDLIAPIGKGQRSLIVSPPKAGKTTLIKDIATGVARNHPEIHVMAVLVGERPEEVTDIGRHIAKITEGKGEIAASNFDEPADQQCAVAELALERAKRLVEEGRDVLILLDSITRLARAYNLSIPTSGRTLSGGFDPAALFPPKRFFGAARNFERPGSLTIIGTALVDTGSRMDDLVYEEFKGTGNQEVHLDRHLAERRIFPGIEVQKSGTRRDDLLIDQMTYQSVMTLHQMLDMLDRDERTETLIGQLKKAKTNKDFLAGLRAGF